MILGNIYWSTEKAHSDNTETMQDFLDNHLDPDLEIIYQCGSYAEVIDKNGCHYSLHASGNGDFNNHLVRFELI